MKTSVRFLFLAAGICLWLFSCTKSEKTVPIKLLLTDNPATYDSVIIHLTGIRVKMNTEEDQWTPVKSKDTVINLLDLQNGLTTVLSEDNVPAGNLKEVRFILGDGNYVVVSGTRYPMATPSAETSGLKIKIDKDLNETLNTFTLDFDAAASVLAQNGTYKLMPVIKVKS